MANPGFSFKAGVFSGNRTGKLLSASTLSNETSSGMSDLHDFVRSTCF